MIEFVLSAPAYLRLGDIHERRGEQTRALEFSKRVLRRWSDGEPQVQAALQEARSRVDRLTRLTVPSIGGM